MKAAAIRARPSAITTPAITAPPPGRMPRIDPSTVPRRIAGALSQMTNAQASEGAAYNRISALTSTSTNTVNNLTSSLSSVEDVDTAKAATELTMQQASYQASLAAMSNVLQLSLTQFLK